MKKRFIFIAREEETGKFYSFNGGHQLSKFIGIASNTVYRNIGYTLTEKVYNGYRFAYCEQDVVKYKNRGSSILSSIKKKDEY